MVAYLLMILVVGDLRCCLGGSQGGHLVCLIVVMVVSICLCSDLQACLLMMLVVGDLRCCLGGGQGGHKVCLIVVVVVFVVVFVVVTRSTC